jgi:hypothetical protein
VPVLVVAFNRPAQTARVLDALRRVAPKQVYVHIDGPRRLNATDGERVARTRDLFQDIKWDGEVHRLFQERNIGIQAEEFAIDWFFQNVDCGIILEDDCVPTDDFFRFCAELLERYREQDQVMAICGYNELRRWQLSTSYHFSRTTSSWGWATWRRAWARYDAKVTRWAIPATRRALIAQMLPAERRIWPRRFDSVWRRRYLGYDFAWQFAVVAHGGLAAVPASNLVTNIGFDDDALSTRLPWPHQLGMTTHSLAFPLVHPAKLVVDFAYERALYRHRFPLSRKLVAALPAVAQMPLRRLLLKLPRAHAARVDRQ